MVLGVAINMLQGHTAHDPTKYRAPAYSFRGTKSPAATSCSPGPRYFIPSYITKTGKHLAPSAHVTARPKTKLQVTPGPSDYTTDNADKHVYQTAPASSLKFRPKDVKSFRTPGPGTYTLPRVLGPHTVYTHAEPSYSMKWKSLYQSCFQDLAKTPGPAAFANVEMDVYKRRAPKYSMGLRTKLAGTGHTAHDPTKYRAPAYSFRGTKSPAATSCSPGPRYFIPSYITKTGKHLAPSAHVTARPKTKLQVTPGPSDYTTDNADKHVYQTAPASSLKFRPKDGTHLGSLPIPFPGPGTYTLPRVLGPHTVYTHAEPSYSMKWKSLYQSCFQDLAKTPGPAAFANVEMDVYKRRAPKYSMGLRTKLAGTGMIPGPADYFPGKLSVTKARDPAFTFGLRHSVYKASLIPETPLD
ncbi:hypothetical protein HGM15179_000809 [Zosterops borbonicus]|uniref:Outer dense fiber protein 3 n=1 Tax=Zosterops borbonicus TaxID=364589 RepID=A0A8K1GY41_9PASS|nr:hypothetical protein HGM15179_000809 [Zosterops borbonicus]